MTVLEELFKQPPAKWVLTTEQISAAAVAIGLTPTMAQVADLCGGHISAIMSHAAAKVGWFGPGIVLEDTAEDWRTELWPSCDECEGVPTYRVYGLEPDPDERIEILHWDQMRWEIADCLDNYDREEAEEIYGPMPESADHKWVQRFVEEQLSSNNRVGESCLLARITLGDKDAYGIFNVSGFSFTALYTNFYGASYDREVAIAWRIRNIGVQHESEVTEETVQLLDFTDLRNDVLKRWSTGESAKTESGNT